MANYNFLNQSSKDNLSNAWKNNPGFRIVTISIVIVFALIGALTISNFKKIEEKSMSSISVPDEKIKDQPFEDKTEAYRQALTKDEEQRIDDAKANDSSILPYVGTFDNKLVNRVVDEENSESFLSLEDLDEMGFGQSDCGDDKKKEAKFYDKDGYDQFGYDKYGYDRNGYDKDGYDKNGYDKNGFDKDGYDRNGYDKNGFDKNGYNRNGYDKNGFDKNGYDKDGFDKEGFNKNGINRSGYDRNGNLRDGLIEADFGPDGYAADGYDRWGYDREGYDKNGLDKNGFNREGYDKNGFDKNGFDKDGYDKNGFDKNGFDKDGFDKDGYDKNGYDKFGYDKNGYDKNGYDRWGYDKNGFDKDGFDKNGFDKYGFDRNGNNKAFPVEPSKDSSNGDVINSQYTPEELKEILETKKNNIGAQMKALTQVTSPVYNSVSITAIDVKTQSSSEKSQTISQQEGEYGYESLLDEEGLQDIKEQKLLIPAGDISYAVTLTEANSDVRGPVLAKILTGPLKGFKVLGNFQTSEDYLVIMFNKAILGEEEYDITAVALDPATTLPGMADYINHHYFSRIILPMAATFIESVGKSVAEPDSETIVSDGVVVTNKEEKSTSESFWEAVGEAGGDMGDILEESVSDEPTIKVFAGAEMGLLFTEALKVDE